jgi:hypothetical protein
MGRAIRRPIRTGFARNEDLDHFFSIHRAAHRRSRSWAWIYHSPEWVSRRATTRMRMVKKPVAFSTICRASSRLRSRPNRGFQTSRVRLIRLSFAACSGFTEDFTVDSEAFRTSGCRLQNPTGEAGPTATVGRIIETGCNWRAINIGDPWDLDA